MKKMIKITIAVVTILFFTSLFATYFSDLPPAPRKFSTVTTAPSVVVPATTSSNEISGYIINSGIKDVMTNGFGSFSVVHPFQTSGESAQDYLTSNAYTPFNGSKIVYLTTKPYSQNDPTNQGCAFIFTSDNNGYYITSAPIGKSIDCHVNTSDSSGFVKKNVLVVNVTS